MGAQVKAIVDKLLTNASNKFVPTGFIADLVLPPLYVQQKTGKLGVYGNGHLRLESSIGGGRGAFRRVDATVRTTTSYDIEVHGLEGMVTPDDYANVEQPFDAEEDEMNNLITMLLIEKEYALAAALTNTGVITNNVTLAGQDQYSDFANSDPLEDALTAHDSIYDATGMSMNTAIMPTKVYKRLRYHPQLLRSLGYADNRPGGLRIDELASALDVERILIANAVYNSAKEGQADSITPIWGKHLVYAYIPQTAMKNQKTLGYRMQLNDQKRSQRAVYKYPINNPPGSNGIIVQDNWDFFLVDTAAAYLIKDAIA